MCEEAAGGRTHAGLREAGNGFESVSVNKSRGGGEAALERPAAGFEVSIFRIIIKAVRGRTIGSSGVSRKGDHVSMLASYWQAHGAGATACAARGTWHERARPKSGNCGAQGARARFAFWGGRGEGRDYAPALAAARACCAGPSQSSPRACTRCGGRGRCTTASMTTTRSRNCATVAGSPRMASSIDRPCVITSGL
jgi:hypothetical protein